MKAYDFIGNGGGEDDDDDDEEAEEEEDTILGEMQLQTVTIDPQPPPLAPKKAMEIKIFHLLTGS